MFDKGFIAIKYPLEYTLHTQIVTPYYKRGNLLSPPNIYLLGYS